MSIGLGDELMIIKNGTVFNELNKFQKADLLIENGKIVKENLENKKRQPVEEIIDARECYVIPGLIDIHIHGSNGADFCDGKEESFQIIADYLAKKGITSFLGTSMTFEEERLTHIFSEAEKYMGNNKNKKSARMQGIHMEGPFLSVKKRGAQNAKYIQAPNWELFQRLYKASGNKIKIVDVAPEEEGAIEFIENVSKKCAISLSHSNATFEEAMEAFRKGANQVTHIFNGMSPFSHKDPGIVGAAIEKASFIELISDGIHVHPSMVRNIFTLFSDERVCLISDSMAATGKDEGIYKLGGQRVSVVGKKATLENGTLAGSTTCLMDCVRAAVSFGVPLESVIKAATYNPARAVGIDDKKGSISIGKDADIVILTKDLQIKAVIIQGVKVDGAEEIKRN